MVYLSLCKTESRIGINDKSVPDKETETNLDRIVKQLNKQI